MADSIKEVLGTISKAAKAQGVEFRLARKGRKHLIYHLGDTVVLPVPHSQVPSRIKFEMYKQCEAELGYRWWQPADRRVEAPSDLPCTVAKGYRGPRDNRVLA
jgi:hypothetical protein